MDRFDFKWFNRLMPTVGLKNVEGFVKKSLKGLIQIRALLKAKRDQFVNGGEREAGDKVDRLVAKIGPVCSGVIDSKSPLQVLR